MQVGSFLLSKMLLFPSNCSPVYSYISSVSSDISFISLFSFYLNPAQASCFSFLVETFLPLGYKMSLLGYLSLVICLYLSVSLTGLLSLPLIPPTPPSLCSHSKAALVIISGCSHSLRLHPRLDPKLQTCYSTCQLKFSLCIR